MTIDETLASLGEDVTDHRLSRPDCCASRARRAVVSRSGRIGPHGSNVASG